MASNKKLEINQSPEHSMGRASSGDSSPLIEDDSPSRWASLSPNLKKAIVIGVVVGVILLIALIVLIVVLTENRCSFSSSPPRHLTPRAIYTKPDATNLAKFAGYIHVYDLGFLALDIKRMTVGLENFIRLEDDCVTLTIGYSTKTDDPRGPIVQMNEIDWVFNNGGVDIERKRLPYEICQLDDPHFYHTFKKTYHYSCREREAHECLKGGRDGQTTLIAELVIESFELELDGNEDIIYQGSFSKPPYPNSCDSFMAALALNSTGLETLPRTTNKPAKKE